MSSIRKLASQTAIYGVSSIVARLLNYLLTPYLTRIMTSSEYGAVTDMYALIPFALVILTMGMESGYFRFAGKAETPDEKQKVFSTTWGAVTAFSVLFFSAVLLFRGELATITGYGQTPSYITVVAGIIALDAITAIPLARLRERGQAGKYVFVRVMSVVVNVLLTLFFYSVLPRLAESGSILSGLYSQTYGAGYVFVANLIASAVAMFILLPSCRGAVRFDKRLLGRIALYSFPLLVSGVAGTANEFIDRQMIKYLMPQDVAMSALGVYGAVVKIGVVMLLFTQMYRLAAEPFFLANFKKDEFVNTNAQAMKYFIMVSIMIFLGITLFVDLFALIIGPDFREGIYILPVVLVANILSGVVLNLSFWYKQTGKTKFALVVTGTGLLFTVLFNFMLVPRLGYFGAAIARLICEMAMVGVSFWLSYKYFRIPYDLKRIAQYVLVGAMLYGVSFATAELSPIPKYLCNLALLTVYAVFVVRKEKIDVVGMVRSAFRK